MISETDIKKFQQLYKEEFGIEISKEEAAEQGLKLVTLMSHVYKPMTEGENDGIELHRNSTKDNLIACLGKKDQKLNM